MFLWVHGAASFTQGLWPHLFAYLCTFEYPQQCRWLRQLLYSIFLTFSCDADKDVDVDVLLNLTS
jgi:hypothetical protein